MAKKTKFDDCGSDVRLRKSKYCSHRRKARLWLFPLVIVNTLFYFWLIGATAGAVFTKFSSASIGFLLASMSWRMLKKIRRIRAKHLILAEGYAKPFAEDIVARARSEDRKFALFLRGFDFEARSVAPSEMNVEVGSRDLKLFARPVEALLVEMLSDDLPLIALTSPMDPHPIGGAYRFRSVPSDWKQFVSELLPDAFPVIMHLTSSFSLGLLEEVELLKHSGYSKKAVIIVGKNIAVENSDAGKWQRRVLAQFEHVVFQQTDSAWSRRHEIDFHWRLRKCLQTLECDSQGSLEIVRKDRDGYTVVTPPWWSKGAGFIRGPALVSTVLFLPLGMYYFYNGMIAEIVMLPFLWAFFVVLASILRGLFRVVIDRHR